MSKKSCAIETERDPCIEDFKGHDDYVEIGIVTCPDYLESSLFGLTELGEGVIVWAKDSHYRQYVCSFP
jgi:hypothetical protein